MNINRNKSNRIYMKEDMLFAIASIIIFMNYRLLISLVTLSTLNTLKILIDLNAENLLEFPPYPFNIRSSTSDKQTIAASNIFILSAKYSNKPYPKSFNPISTVNIIVNVKLN